MFSVLLWIVGFISMERKQQSTKVQIVKIILIFITLFILADRLLLLIASEKVDARIIDCHSKWVEVSDSRNSGTKEQVQYYPTAQTIDGIKVIGSIPIPTKELCGTLVSERVSVLLHPTDPNKHTIFSFTQFWALPLLALVVPVLVLLILFNRKINRQYVWIFTISFVSLICYELGLLRDITNNIVERTDSNSRFAQDSQTSSVGDPRSKKKLDRCIWASMHKERVELRRNLRKLICQDQKVTDLSSIADLTSLEELYLQNNNLQSLATLADFQYLRIISVAGNKAFSSTTGIEKAPNLIEFQANKTKLSELTGMETLSKLQVIGAMMNDISDISPLTELTALEDITLSYNNIQDISALANKPLLKKLTIYDNPIADISSLFGNIQLVVFGFSSKVFSQCEQVEELKANLNKDAKIYAPKHCN